MSIPTPRTPIDQPALIWHREGDFSTEPVRFGQDKVFGTAIQAADELLTFYGVVRTEIRSSSRVDVRYSTGAIKTYIGSPVIPTQITTSDVADFEDRAYRLLDRCQFAALSEFLYSVADDAEGDLLRQRAERLLVDIVGPSVAVKEDV